MLPIRDGLPAWTGALGVDLSIEEGMNAARLAAENAVAALHADLGSVADVRVVRLGVYLRASPSFIDHARVADAASLRLRELLGSAGEHARLVFGVASLPGGMPVELEVVCMRSGGAGREGARR
jgi:enamine deaminase RidA (YjgF/YER057c/UK114 family)